MKLRYNQKTGNRLKVCQGSIYQKKHGKFPITNKTGHLKVQIKASFCKTLVASAPTFGIL